MDKAIVIRAFGGPEVLTLEDITVDTPASGELVVRQTAVAVNFHDTYVRSGLYKTLALPGIPGLEGVGVVEAVGSGVTRFRAGERIAYVTKAYGGYASRRLVQAACAVPAPAALDDATLAASFMKGLTTGMLAERHERLAAGETVLVHAAAGGVGQLLCQWAAHLGCRVIGTVGSAEKAALARRTGCSEVIDYNTEDFVAATLELTGGKGVDVVYDAVGRTTIDGSFACLAERGRLVNFGQASGPVPPIEMTRLFAKSLRIGRPSVFHYIDTPETLARLSERVFAAMTEGWVRPPQARTFALKDAGAAHEALESRAPGGPPILVP